MRQDLKDLFEAHRNEIVLDFSNIYLLIGIEEDEDDTYWRYQPLKGRAFNSSCVGGFIPLKGKIDQEDYERLERLWELNKFYGTL